MAPTPAGTRARRAGQRWLVGCARWAWTTGPTTRPSAWSSRSASRDRAAGGALSAAPSPHDAKHQHQHDHDDQHPQPCRHGGLLGRRRQFKLTLLPPTRASNSVTALSSGLLSYRHWATWPLRSHGQPGASPVSDVRPRRPQTGPDRVDQGQEMGYIRRYRAWSIANRPKATNPSATAVRRNFPNGCARIVCSAPSSPCACCRSKVSVA
jgi:hypothetical protein